MLKPQPMARWDPHSRAGAVAVVRKQGHEAQAISDTADIIMDYARYEKLDGSLDNVETSKVRGTYDWRAYLQEEAEAARGRQAERARTREKEKKPQARPPAPAPSHLYA